MTPSRQACRRLPSGAMERKSERDMTADNTLLNLVQHDTCDQAKVAEPSLPVDAGLREHCGAVHKRPLSCLPKQAEDSPVFRAHERLKARKCCHVKVLPMPETPSLQHSKAAQARAPALVRADKVVGMLPIAHRRVGIITHLPAAGRHGLIEPPVM